MTFEVGKIYDAVINGKRRKFTVVDFWEEKEFLIQWDDGDAEYAYVNDMKRWIEDALYRVER